MDFLLEELLNYQYTVPVCRGWQNRGRTSGCTPLSKLGCRVQSTQICTRGALTLAVGVQNFVSICLRVQDDVNEVHPH